MIVNSALWYTSTVSHVQGVHFSSMLVLATTATLLAERLEV
jgi:hypothetical protein